MVSTGLERIPRRRTERSGVEIVVRDTLRSQRIKSRRLDGAAEGAGATEANVVDQYDYDIGRALGCLDLK